MEVVELTAGSPCDPFRWAEMLRSSGTQRGFSGVQKPGVIHSQRLKGLRLKWSKKSESFLILPQFLGLSQSSADSQ